MITLPLLNSAATEALGAHIATSLKAGDIIALTGDLGAGKTTLARGLIKALCDVSEVPSPTYTLIQTYDAPEFEVWHCDLYRLERPGDAYELGLSDAFEEAVCLIEWPNKLGEFLPDTAMTVDIQFTESGRDATLTGFGDRLKGCDA